MESNEGALEANGIDMTPTTTISTTKDIPQYFETPSYNNGNDQYDGSNNKNTASYYSNDVVRVRPSKVKSLYENYKSKKTEKNNTATKILTANSDGYIGSTGTITIANPTSTNISDNKIPSFIDSFNDTVQSVPTTIPTLPVKSSDNRANEAPIKNNNISSGIDNQTVEKSNTGNGGTIVVILMVVIVGIVCAAYFVIKRRRKTGEEKLSDEDIESYSVPFNTTMSRQGSEDNFKYSKGKQTNYSISLNEDNNSLNHPLPTIPNQNEVQEYNSLNRKQIKPENNGVESIATREAHYGNNDSSQYVIDSIASTQYPPQYTVTAQYQDTDQYSTTDQNQDEVTHNTSLSQNQNDNSQYTTTSQSPQANQYTNESVDNQVTSNSSKYIFDDQDDDTSSSSSPRYGYDTMDHQTLSQSSKYLYDSIDRNMSLTSRSIFDSMENLKLSQSSKNLLESKNINLSQSIFDSLDNQSSQNHVFDPNNSSIDIYATEAVISLSDDVMEAVDVKYTRNH